VSDFLDDRRKEITDRLRELRPVVDEFNRLEAAVEALAGVVGSTASEAGSVAVATVTRSRKRGPGRPRGSGKRARKATRASNDRVQRFTSEGSYLSQVGTAGNENGQFNKPEGIATSSSGSVVAADTGNNRIQESLPQPSTTTYGYDQAGNLTAAERRAEGASSPEIEDTYAYNGEDLRTSQTISGTTSYLAWDMTEGLPQILSDGTNSYIYGPGNLPIEQISSGGTVTYLHHDQQGSTRLLTGSTGTVTGKCTYNAYGAPTCEGTTTTPLGYAGQYTSSDTGLIYMRARVYDPATAQFLTVDPLDQWTHAPYTYAGDNPLNEADPSGRSVLGEIGNFLEPLNPIKYYEEEIESYENGCGYFASVAHGLEGAVVGTLDVSGEGEEEGLAAEGSADGGISATAHGAEQLAARGFSGADIALTKSGETLTQADGATVYLKEVSSGRFNVIVEGQRGVVTALKNIPQGAVERLASGYGWH
jgi:RHS repeat-associated protein